MEATVWVCLIMGLGSALLALGSAACVSGVEDACVMPPPANMVTLILSTVTLVPVVSCLITAWLDARVHSNGEQQPLLSSGGSAATSTSMHPRRVITYLYASHLLSAWGDRIWGFAVPILFMDIFVDTLLPSAAFSLAMYLVCIFMIPTVGHHLDRWNRWTAMKYAILLENLMIVVNAIILGLILLVTNADGVHKPEWTWSLALMFAGTLVCGGVGQVLNDAQTLGIERDWVVVIAGSNSAKLAKLNTTMRRIDLSCNILGPMAFGFIVDFAGSDATTRAMVGAAVVGLWNLISTPLEYCMTHDIYHLVPELAIRAPHEEDHQVDAKGQKVPSPTSSAELGTMARYAKMWSNYVKHPVFLVSFSFCALYMTILSGGALNTAYLKWRGISNALLGASRGAGAVTGLVGTLIFPYLRNSMKRVERVAVLSVWLFWLCLAPVLLAFLFTGESVVSDYVMLTCVVISRAWLWNTDLAETQIMQEWIAPNQRGSINSMQTATYQFFFILIQLSGVVFHDPRQFEALVMFSLAAVLASAIGFTYWGIKYGRHRDIYVPTKTTSPPTSV